MPNRKKEGDHDTILEHKLPLTSDRIQCDDGNEFDMMAYSKSCNMCGVDKPLTDFHKNYNCKYGVSERCKKCIMKIWHEKNPKPNKQCIICGQDYSPTGNCQKTCSIQCTKIKNRNYEIQYTDKRKIVRHRTYHKNPQKAIARTKKYTLENPEQVKATKRKYRQTKHAKLLDAKYRHIRRTNGAKGFDPYAFEIKKQNLGNCCVFCGSTENIQCDHILPVKFKMNEIDNLQPLCVSCNSSKHDNIVLKPMVQYPIWVLGTDFNYAEGTL